MGVKVREKTKGSGEWWVFIDHHGDRKARKIGDRKAANGVASEIRQRLASDDFHLTPKARTFEVLAKDWLGTVQAIRELRQTTTENYRSVTEQHLIPYFGRRPVNEITAESIEAFIAAKRAPGGSVLHPTKPLGRSSIRACVVALRLILTKAVRAREIPTNPLRDVDMPLGKSDVTTTVDPFTTEELRAIISAADTITTARTTPAAEHFGLMIRLWAATGMRAGEVAALKWSDLDLQRGTVRVERTYSRRRVGPTKTGRNRTVDLRHPIAEPTTAWRPDPHAPILKAFSRITVRPIDGEGYIFGPQAPAGPASTDWVRTLWLRTLRAAKVRPRVAEQLRHTWASTMLSRNAPAIYVQQQGGWRSATVLFRVYASWMPSELDRIGEAQNGHNPQPSATQPQPAPAQTPALAIVR